MKSFSLRDVLLVVFNLLPLALVIDGYWRPFDVLAFYWLELIAAGFFCTLGSVLSTAYNLSNKKIAATISLMLQSVFFPVHFGFFIVMLCFAVGSFLPEDTPTRLLTDPFIPMIVVIENMPFFEMLPIVMAWQCFNFITQFLITGRYKDDSPGYIASAYASLFILFTSAFFGILIGMATDSRLWGAIILVALKTLAAYMVLHIKRAETPVGPAETS